MRGIISVIGVIAVCLAATSAFARTETRSMSFENCNTLIRQMAGQFGIAPVNIVETTIMRVVRFPTTDGSVLVTCSAPDRKMIVEQSSARCGIDVNC